MYKYEKILYNYNCIWRDWVWMIEKFDKSCCFPFGCFVIDASYYGRYKYVGFAWERVAWRWNNKRAYQMTEAAKIAISRTEIITIKQKRKRPKGGWQRFQLEGKGSKKAWREKKFWQGRLCLWARTRKHDSRRRMGIWYCAWSNAHLDISGNEGLPDMSLEWVAIRLF